MNAIGEALVTGRPVQVFSAEHLVRTHHEWVCTRRSSRTRRRPAAGRARHLRTAGHYQC